MADEADAQKPVTLAEMRLREELQLCASRDFLERAQKGRLKGGIDRPPIWIERQIDKIRVEEAILSLIEWAISKKATDAMKKARP